MKRILVAVDLSENAELVVTQAVQLARALGGKLRLFHAVVVPAQVAPPPGVFAVPPAMSVDDLLNAGRSMLERLLATVPAELRDGADLQVGSPADSIIEEARSCDADLVAIGAHEHGLVARALGTTAARIVNRIDRPVLVVRRVPV